MLPAGCKRVAWIRSTGTQAINTGLYPNQDMRIVMDVVQNTLSNIGVGTGFCAYGGGEPSQNWIEFYTWSSQYQCNYGTEQKSIPAALGDKLHIDQNKNVLSLTRNGVKTDYTYTYKAFTALRTLYLFAINRSDIGTTYRGSATLEACQIYDNGTLVRDYIPYIDASGDANLWDEVTNAPAEKEGTFIAGPIIEPPSAPESVRTALSVLLLWNPSTGADSYNIYRDGVLIGTTTAAQFVDTTAEENETYTYAVSAVGIGGESARTEIIVYTRTGYFQYKPYIQSANFQ